MKKYIVLIVIVLQSCVGMDYAPTTEISSDTYWRTIEDARSGVDGVYPSWKDVAGWQYVTDGWTDLAYDQGCMGSGWGYGPRWTSNTQNIANGFPGLGAMDQFWKLNYQIINRVNSTLEDFERVPIKSESERILLEQYKGELRFMRAYAYFYLLDIFGEVPYYEKKVSNEEAFALHKMGKSDLKDRIIEDFSFAADNLRIKYSDADFGRFTKGAAIAMRGKVRLFWASWQERDANLGKDGNLTEALEYYALAAKDFEEVMKPAYGYTLYKNGLPGTYKELFVPANSNNSEIVLSVRHLGPNLGLGNILGGAALGNRSILNSPGILVPVPKLWDIYQDRTTGDYDSPITYGDGSAPTDFANPTAFENRDLRMDATVVLFEKTMSGIKNDGNLTEPLPYNPRFPNKAGYIRSDQCTGNLLFRKYVIQWPGITSRGDCNMDVYLMRFSDVMLMYAEAMNKVNGPREQLFELVDQIRYRGGLPSLDRSKFNTKEAFHDAIVQERAVELILEGARFYDIRRWGMVEKLFGANAAFYYRPFDNQGKNVVVVRRWENATNREFQRFYLFSLPLSEINKNPNLLPQNPEW